MITTLKLPGYLLIACLLVALNLLPNLPQGWQTVFGALYLIFFALVLGNWLFIKNSLSAKLIFGLLFILLTAGLLGTASFYFWNLDAASFTAILIIIPILLIPVINRYPLIFESKKLEFDWKISRVILLLIYLLLLATIFFLLFNSQTDAAIRTPWQVVPPEIFLLYFLATFFLFCFLAISKNFFNLSLIIAHLLMSFAVAVIVYQIGFDYDPFIHRKNLEIISSMGTLLPKPFYYIGQYSLLIFLKNLLHLSTDLLDKILVPILAALYLPTTIYYAFKDNYNIKTSYLYLIILGALIFPFGVFTVTTPQSLATLTYIITITFALYYLVYPKTPLLPLVLLTLFTLAVHPLAGLPLLFASALIIFYFRFQKQSTFHKLLHRGILWEIFVLGCLTLPIAFIVNSKTLSQLKVNFNFDLLSNVRKLIFHRMEIFYRPFITIYDLVYSYAHNIIIFFLVVVVLSILVLKRKQQLKKYLIYPAISLMLLINYYLLKVGMDFFTLIDYERMNYLTRVLQLCLYSLLPLLIIGGYWLWLKIFQQKSIIILLMLIFLSLGVTAAFYLSYPRVDTIAEDHGYSTSATDIKTVQLIDKLQLKEPYIVLASQPVSAAAIKELGYKCYYQGFYFYPVPTGSRLYQLYEDLVYKKEKTEDVIATVRFLTGVNDVYLVINSYWYDAQNKIEEEKEISDKWYAIDGKNYIFKYTN